jgi:hypothetical protein
VNARPGFFDAMGWLEDFADCLAGEGAVSADVADKWMERNADLPTDGTSWQHWRDFRRTGADGGAS